MAGATFSRIKTWITEVLTASDLNAEFDNILNNFLPDGMDDASVNDAAMQAVRDPYPAEVISKPTDLTGEIQGLRFQTKAITGKSQWYFDADTSLLLQFNKGADIASATALPIGAAADGNYFDITGTTTVTSFTTRRVGDIVRLHFDGALILTHHATDLILPTAANITTVAGDEATFIEYATGDWRCLNYQRASGENIATLSHNHSSASTGGDALAPVTMTPSAWPSFSATLDGNDQSIGTGAWVKVQFDTEEFDTNSDFDAATNYRFTPTVAGKYILTAGAIVVEGMALKIMKLAIYKNGSSWKQSGHLWGNAVTLDAGPPPLSIVVDANGSSDYFEVFVWHDLGSDADIGGVANETFFSGCRVG